jgi:hypothetical protein
MTSRAVREGFFDLAVGEPGRSMAIDIGRHADPALALQALRSKAADMHAQAARLAQAGQQHLADRVTAQLRRSGATKRNHAATTCRGTNMNSRFASHRPTPTNEGRHKYPHTDGYFPDLSSAMLAPDTSLPCSCTVLCEPRCAGECGFAACSLQFVGWADESGYLEPVP